MCNRKELDIILEKLMDAYQKVYGSAIDKILLYGSYAREDYKEDSDIDVVAIVHGRREELQNQLKQIWDYSAELELEYEIILSPTVIPFDEFERIRMICHIIEIFSRRGL